MRNTDETSATLCYYFAPLFVVVAASIFMRETLTPLRIGCILCAVGGMVFVSGVLVPGIEVNFLGIGFGLGSAFVSEVLASKKASELTEKTE